MVKTARKKAAPKQLTTAQRLDSIIKSARKIMRKDKGLSGDLDRLPMLTWIMFLKFLDDMERIEEERAELAGKDYRPIVEPPYRWRDWAADADGITGPDLLNFLTSEVAERPDGTRGPGLFAYLRGLRGDNGRRERRDVISTVFQGFANRMTSGYLLRDVINLIGGIHFDSSEEVHVLGRLYETLLREMRDAAGDSGEFYTPRPVVRFMVEVTDPRLGETVLDPACGTGGFLTEAFQHLEKQADTVEKRRTLQEQSIYGGEAKPLPFLLVQMNLLLHGLDAPKIDPLNGLRFRLAEIGEAERVNVILTNPPFAGEEEAGILNNFPEDRRTAETALLFLQLIMRRLKKAGQGRAAVVIPNGTLFGDGMTARIKADLLEQFNLHTIVRLPEGVFSPYTDIPTNIIFFDTSGPTRDIWYYEQARPEGRKKYSKTAPMNYDEFMGCVTWWKDRKANERAWRVSAADLIVRDVSGRVVACNLDIKNPHAEEPEDHRKPIEILDAIIERAALIQLDTGGSGHKSCRGFSTLAGSAVCQIVVTASTGSVSAAAAAHALYSHLLSAIQRQHARRTLTRCGDSFAPGAAGCWASSHPGPMRRTLVWLVDAAGSPPAVSLNPATARPWTKVLPMLPAGVPASVLKGNVGASNAYSVGAGGIAGAVPDVLMAAGLGLDAFRVFISYRRADTQAFADQLFDGLSHQGFDVYLDRFRTNPGTNFAERIRSELADKGCVVLLDSREVRASSWVAGEYAFARFYRLGLMAIDVPGGRRSFHRIGTRLDLRRSKITGAFTQATRLSDSAVTKAVDFVRRHYHAELSRRFRYQRELVRHAAALTGVPAAISSDGLVELTGPHPYLMAVSARPPGVEEFQHVCQAVQSSKFQATAHRAVVVGPLAAQAHQSRETIEWLGRSVGAVTVNELRLFKAMRRASRGRL